MQPITVHVLYSIKLFALSIMHTRICTCVKMALILLGFSIDINARDRP